MISKLFYYSFQLILDVCMRVRQCVCVNKRDFAPMQCLHACVCVIKAEYFCTNMHLFKNFIFLSMYFIVYTVPYALS